jgi:hypothetical protein
MKFKKINVVLSIFGFISLILFASCEKKSGSIDCEGIKNKLATDKAAFNSAKTEANCHAVVVDYNNLINPNCDPDGSYVNERDAFKTSNSCQ